MDDNLQVEVRENTSEHRFEAHIDGEVAGVVDYRTDDGKVVATHTEVADEYEGAGVAARLVDGMLDQLRADGRGLDNRCEYIAGYLDKHPEYSDVLA